MKTEIRAMPADGALHLEPTVDSMTWVARSGPDADGLKVSEE